MAATNGIHDSSTTMKAALRALSCAIYGLKPDPEDLGAILRYAPDLAHFELDDLARQVVQRLRAARARAVGGDT
jgi:hypothetical protein